MTQAQHRAQTHPRLVRALDGAIAAERAATGVLVGYYSTKRGQLDCTGRAGACSTQSKHSRRLAEAADMGGYSKSDGPSWRRFAGRVTDPCVEWGGTYRTPDNNHFELQWDRPGCRGSALDETGDLARSVGRQLTPQTAALAAASAFLLVLALR